MSYSTWHNYGYGIRVDDIKEQSVERLQALLKLADLAIELREDVSLASFTAGFQLALGIAGELTPYSFEDDEEERALRRQEQETR